MVTNASETQATALHERPLAAAGLDSYRLRGEYGYIMIGALSPQDAMREARRTWPGAPAERLEKWDAGCYVRHVWK